jgi:hypothetical protein
MNYECGHGRLAPMAMNKWKGNKRAQANASGANICGFLGMRS